MTCLHGRGACCWLCSNKVPFWREARIKAGLGEDPPNVYVEACEPEPEVYEPVKPVIRLRPPMRVVLRCLCGAALAQGNKTGRCVECRAAVRRLARRSVDAEREARSMPLRQRYLTAGMKR